MPKQAKVHLGGREYIISEKVMGVSLKWREKLRASRAMAVFESLDGAIEQLVGIVGDMADAQVDGRMAMAAGISFAAVAPSIVRGLSWSIDEVIDLLLDYSPELQADHEWLLENAYNDELVGAFLEVLKLNFPITALWGLVSGSRAQATSTNLPSTNGAGGPKKVMGRQKTR